MKRYVYMISDGTGITVASLGSSLLTQFEHIDFDKQIIPYIDSQEKADAVLEQINNNFKKTGVKPLVFLTIVNPEINLYLVSQANACFFDLFSAFLSPLEQELNTKSSYTVGKAHSVSSYAHYEHRMEALNYTLTHDDGVSLSGYDKADIILVGVSRCGKTPSCLFMALHFGIFAANYPFTDNELHCQEIPHSLKPYKEKLFGLSIDVKRLQQIRTERRPNSQYASMEQCLQEVANIESLFHQEKIPFLNSTRYSVEEISTKIIEMSNLERRI